MALGIQRSTMILRMNPKPVCALWKAAYKMTYINRISNFKTLTVAEFANHRKAEAAVNVCRAAEPDKSFYLSQKPCENWSEVLA
jgi:hypothetical protein